MSLPTVGFPEAALGLEMSGASGRAPVSFFPTSVSALLTPPGFTKLACARDRVSPDCFFYSVRSSRQPWRKGGAPDWRSCTVSRKKKKEKFTLLGVMSGASVPRSSPRQLRSLLRHSIKPCPALCILMQPNAANTAAYIDCPRTHMQMTALLAPHAMNTSPLLQTDTQYMCTISSLWACGWNVSVVRARHETPKKLRQSISVSKMKATDFVPYRSAIDFVAECPKHHQFD